MDQAEVVEIKTGLSNALTRGEVEMTAMAPHRMFLIISLPRLDAINRIDGMEAGDDHLEAAYHILSSRHDETCRYELERHLDDEQGA